MKNVNQNKIRLQALDALRGLAILMMVLSANIPYEGALPGWMYHAQLPPPGHYFQGDIPGITWVDLVFPFFLFAMGAAIPFSLGSKMDKGVTNIAAGKSLLIRFGGLALFAIVSQHSRPWMLGVEGVEQWFLSLLAMVGMLMIFAAPVGGMWSRYRRYVVMGGFLLLAILFGVLHNLEHIQFSHTTFDIIIMVLANTALGGGLIYFAWRYYRYALWIGFALFVAFFLSGRDGDNWVATIYNYSPVSWLLSWNYLKYMIIIIPGVYTGSVIRAFMLKMKEQGRDVKEVSIFSYKEWLLFLLSVAIIMTSVIGLYIREMEWAFGFTLLIALLFTLLLKGWDHPWKDVFNRLLPFAVVLVISGYLTEPLHGGIKKDSATLSYMLLTSGLAIFCLFAFTILLDVFKVKRGVFLATGAGKNAMMAYIAGSNLVMPIFAITGLTQLFKFESYFVTLQTVEAVIITLLVAWVSGFAARTGLFMKV
ncbi:DUF5009 domain-containing protein [Marinilabiliaceae bacterium ANBcel2]|nr:DUF5009 domain-containing protein [Marinilabiliaceae bacterium ANBcel2]